MPRAIGLMSGTSLDGVDAAWIETDGETVTSFGPSLTIPYDSRLRRDLRALLERAPTLEQDDPALLDAVARLTDVHIRAVKQLKRPADIIGFHGQTILHQPDIRRTWQVGDATRLARETGIPVAYDFRSDDVAAGGQGAPLVPVYHAALARNLPRPLVVLNIGGVANVTWIGRRGTGAESDLLAFDTGPGNGPLDDWTMRMTRKPFDKDGLLAAEGMVDAQVISHLMSHPYFTRPAPKSLDRLDFSRAIAASGLEHLTAADGAATLAAFISVSIAVASFPVRPLRWLVAGGGRRNPAIMSMLNDVLSEPVETVEKAGWNGDMLEAQCFAFLAVRVQKQLPLSFPGTTGVPAPMPGGRIVP